MAAAAAAAVATASTAPVAADATTTAAAAAAATDGRETSELRHQKPTQANNKATIESLHSRILFNTI